MSRLERDEVPLAMSSCSTSATRSPRLAASRKAPAPTIPPPTTSRSQGSLARRSRSAPRRARGGRVSWTVGGRVMVAGVRGSSGSRTRRAEDPPQHEGGAADQDEDEQRGVEDDALALG